MCEDKKNACALTGHRKFEGKIDLKKLKDSLIYLIGRGVNRFYCGMAEGFDLCAGEILCALKDDYPEIEIIACVPCPSYERYFDEEERDRFYYVSEKCAQIKVVSSHYYSGCMLARDRFMVDSSGVVLAYYDGRSSGGTAYTLSYAKSKSREIYVI